MLFEFINAEQVVIFAHEIAAEIDRLYPYTSQKKIKTERTTRKLNSLVARVRMFAQNNKLNFYKKAKFLNTIKWDLKDAGRDETFVNEVILLLAPVFK